MKCDLSYCLFCIFLKSCEEGIFDDLFFRAANLWASVVWLWYILSGSWSGNHQDSVALFLALHSVQLSLVARWWYLVCSRILQKWWWWWHNRDSDGAVHSLGHLMHSTVLTALCTLPSLVLQSMTWTVWFALSLDEENEVMVIARSMHNRPGTPNFCSRMGLVSPIGKCFVDLIIKAQD